MIVVLLFRLLWFIAILALQVLVFSHIHVWGIATALVCPWFVMLLPQGTNRASAMLWAFALGLAADAFSSTPGLNAASLTAAGLVQPPLLQMLTPKDAIEGFTPSRRTLGLWAYARYAMVLLTVHHLVYFSLEAFSLAYFIDTAIRAAAGWAVSFVFIMSLERLRPEK